MTVENMKQSPLQKKNYKSAPSASRRIKVYNILNNIKKTSEFDYSPNLSNNLSTEI